jgi:3-methyl-2-oxobutanoate hydroxymethyltransferase
MSVKPLGPEAAGGNRPKTTVLTLAEKRRRGEPITMLTAYDYPMARAVDQAGIDAILVGDSLAMVVLGHPNTLTVTMDEMLHHARAVSRGASHPLLIGDMPFMSYQSDAGAAVRNAGRFLQEAGMEAVKLEGGRAFADTARSIVRAGIPVMGHVGLTPQSLNALGGWRVQGRSAPAARTILDDARAMEDAGCFALVVESVPERLGSYLTEQVSIPTIGIGAGPECDGQVLVWHDLLGLYEGRSPRFVKRYADVGSEISRALEAYAEDVRSGRFPEDQHTYAMPEEELEAFFAAR